MPIAYNTTDSPIPSDAAGHVLAGRERGDVDPKVESVADAIDAGRLILVDDIPEPTLADGDDAAETAEPPKKTTSSRQRKDEE